MSRSRSAQPLPASWKECRRRGWDSYDILLVSGDAYVDHPSFGVALIGRYLESHGYRVAILAQPHYNVSDDFLAFPPPRLFCGITAGNLDSIVANYTGNGKVRKRDDYSPEGNPWRSADKNKNNRYRPDRATLIYANLARASFKDTPIILGGIEASLRRFTHYDYQQEKLRASILTDAKADLLVYGMGEKAILEVARRCTENLHLSGIDGTCERLTEREFNGRYIESSGENGPLTLPSFTEITSDKQLFLKAELLMNKHERAAAKRCVAQKQQNHWVIQHPAVPLLNSAELDKLYELPFTRKPHPSTPDIPAYRMIKGSVTIVRGCSGNCSFCAITRHQGAAVESRSNESIINECKTIASGKDFDGTISDLGGPTANLFATSCRIGGCKKRDCLYPEVCKHLDIDEKRFRNLLQRVGQIEGINHLFVSSGLRMELLLRTPALFDDLVAKHIPGAMKIAPEHSVDEVLRLMHKEPHALLKEFTVFCKARQRKTGKLLHLVPYIISSHPGCTEKHALQMANDMKKLGLTISKFQDFTPTPGTLSTAMYVAERDPKSDKKLYVAKNTRERKRQRDLIEQTFYKRKRRLRKSQ